MVPRFSGALALCCWLMLGYQHGTDALSTGSHVQTLSSETESLRRQESDNKAAEEAGKLAAKVAASAVSAAYHHVFRRWAGISHPDFHYVDVETCKVVLSFGVSKLKKAMGGVTRIREVEVNNKKQQLTITYDERPSFSNATDLSRISSWVGRKLASAPQDEVVPVTEHIFLPSECVADDNSRYFVVMREKEENSERVTAVVVELEFNPGVFVVPRDLSKRAAVNQIMSRRQRSPIEEGVWELLPGCVLFIRLRADLRAAPRLAVNVPLEFVQFQDVNLKHFGNSPLPKECTWHLPSTVGAMTRQDKSQDPDQWDVLLFMTDEPSPVKEVYTIPKGGEVRREMVSDTTE
ncbi:hypothetical protein BESB_076020 [Besnoitia besnoiti]|uniref:Uncharacterized protein n=1 Tax=Besnoitia besnoiti TaxID=94643 RepID=A0A2A9M5Z9_BESBE|nr:hypothetical protein BESB_076020 [Besnoitia besnoiti]PFH33385.1 hypothetical protein BESB_076020 [Besnoitia besnoiti]